MECAFLLAKIILLMLYYNSLNCTFPPSFNHFNAFVFIYHSLIMEARSLFSKVYVKIIST